MSYFKEILSNDFRFIFLRSVVSQVILQVVRVIDLYSVSIEDLVITVYFFDFQVIGELPSKM